MTWPHHIINWPSACYACLWSRYVEDGICDWFDTIHWSHRVPCRSLLYPDCFWDTYCMPREFHLTKFSQSQRFVQQGTSVCPQFMKWQRNSCLSLLFSWPLGSSFDTILLLDLTTYGISLLANLRCNTIKPITLLHLIYSLHYYMY